MTSSIDKVSLENLDDSMIIKRYTGFADRFQPMEEKTCKWLQHNFKGVRAIAERNGEKRDFKVDDLRTGDVLVELYSFPESLKKLTVVNKRLKEELQKRGFRQFSVERVQKKTTPAQIRRRESISRSSELISKARENVAVSKGASKAVENLIDETREGKLDTEELTSYIDNIISNGSTEAVGVLASLKKSDQTYAHCVDVGAIFQSVYTQLMKQRGVDFTPEQEREMLKGGFMHDIGKAKVPKEILDSTVRFERDSREMQLMQSHPDFGAEILADMSENDMIINMAHYHHVKLDTTLKSSYPKVDSYDDLNMETRLIAIVDVYQALVGRRSYKKSWAPPAAMKFIDQLSGIEFDVEIWDAFYEIMGKYPTGSLVELSDGSMAFVVQPADKDLERPVVALVRNAKGEDLKNNTLIRLEDEPDIMIVKDLDNYDALGDASLEIFTNLKIS